MQRSVARFSRSFGDWAARIHVPLATPLQSTPLSPLRNLPILPARLEYRVVAHALVLLDVEANLIVGFRYLKITNPVSM
jgi:hypothetical protein